VNTKRRNDLIERFELDPRKKSRTYSKGNRQKVALVAALASDVELLLLDEPTSGLDPLMESVFQECIVEAVSAEKTVLLSSHVLAEVEKLCDRVTIIREGKVVQHGTLEELRNFSRSHVTVGTDRNVTGLEALDGVHHLRLDDRTANFDIDHGALDSAMRHITAFGIRTLVSQPPTLEELFLRHYSDRESPPTRSDMRTIEPVQ
jgi:ABC-2 type transport system ATP-binding protein